MSSRKQAARKNSKAPSPHDLIASLLGHDEVDELDRLTEMEASAFSLAQDGSATLFRLRQLRDQARNVGYQQGYMQGVLDALAALQRG